MTRLASNFPEFDQAYQNALIKDPTDRFEQLAAEANFNVYHSNIWRGTGRKFAELIVKECCEVFVELQTRPTDLAVKDVKKHFGVEK